MLLPYLFFLILLIATQGNAFRAKKRTVKRETPPQSNFRFRSLEQDVDFRFRTIATNFNDNFRFRLLSSLFRSNSDASFRFRAGEKCTQDKFKVLSKCFESFVKHMNLSMDDNGKLPSLSKFVESEFRGPITTCIWFTEFELCTRDVISDCLFVTVLNNLTTTTEDAYGYAETYIEDHLFCKEFENFLNLEACILLIGDRPDAATAITECGKNSTDCGARTDELTCELNILKQECGEIAGLCAFEEKELRHIVEMEESCITKQLERCRSINRNIDDGSSSGTGAVPLLYFFLLLFSFYSY